jgi:molybdopterin-containing oxidoreductase family iron-sulfur binding subunit
MPPLGSLPIYGQPAPERSPLARPRWRTLAEQAGPAEAAPGEFPEGAAETPEGFSRRSFLQVLGASAALAGAAACKPPREKIVGYVRQPHGVTPSRPDFYATAVGPGGYAVGVVVESHTGRPTKVEGNRDHPASLGAAGRQEQALLLDLYDPARLEGVRHRGRGLSWPAFLLEMERLAEGHAADGGARLRFLVEPGTSPTLADLRRLVLERFPRARFDAWGPAGDDASRQGLRIATGQDLLPRWSVGAADVLLALDCDFLGREGDHLRQAREFASRREPPRMNRLYAVEAAYTVTGGMADHRFRMRSSEVLGFARAVAAALAGGHGLGALAPLGAPPATPEVGRIAAAVAADLAGARGKGLVLPGERHPPALHALAAAMNEALGNAGATVTYGPSVRLDAPEGTAGLRRLLAEVAAGAVETLVITAWNPVYTAPADLDLEGALAKIPNVLYLAAREDETSHRAGSVVAASHPLESWGDLRARDGTVTIVQPLVSPLRESASEIDLLAAFAGRGDRGAWRLVREHWIARTGPDGFDRRWGEWLSAGLVPGSAAPSVSAPVDLARVAEALRAAPAPAPGIEVAFAPDYKVGDGRFAENAWLQELPDPITKLTWDNAAMLSPATARRLGVESGDVLSLSLRGRATVAPALVVPGHADEAITVALGYGRAVAGAAGTAVGFDAYALRHADAPCFEGGLAVTRTGRRHALAVTQGHFSMEVRGHERPIALDFTVEELGHHGAELGHHRGELPSLLARSKAYDDQPNQWGMAIDLSRCLGCGACTVACQAENNIPVVGKEQVLVSREMHWIRVDRYFTGSPEDPGSVSQPLACVHCEKAPCEYVCPVNATVHSDEGLNEMVYNRCVGTRYCSNNCPYKVRRFNYLDWRGEVAPTLRMLMNPDVTVRARGVMEKCTYCVQRIERVRADSRVRGEKVVGGDAVVTACQQACPGEAIVFGNLGDPESRVSRLHRSERRYDLLHELGTKPRTAYLVRVRNPNPALA